MGEQEDATRGIGAEACEDVAQWQAEAVKACGGAGLHHDGVGACGPQAAGNPSGACGGSVAAGHARPHGYLRGDGLIDRVGAEGGDFQRGLRGLGSGSLTASAGGTGGQCGCQHECRQVQFSLHTANLLFFSVLRKFFV